MPELISNRELLQLSTLPFHMASFTKGYLAKTMEKEKAANHPAVKLLERIFSVVFIVARIGFGFWWSWRFHMQVRLTPSPYKLMD
jgi:predicted acyltransferase